MWKYVRWAIISIGLVLIVGIGWIRLLFSLVSGGCDEGPFSDWNSANKRGDVAALYAKACTGIGTIVDYSTTLQLHGEKKATTLAEHGDPRHGYPKFHWIDDDTLMIDLGKVNWVSPQAGKVGSIHITYAYSKGE